MQVPDKWKDPYVFVEDFFAHYGNRIDYGKVLFRW